MEKSGLPGSFRDCGRLEVQGEFEERIKKVLAEVAKAGNVLLFIDEIHTIIGAGGAEGAIDASNILKPALARGEVQVIGATTIEEYRKYIEKDAALERRFQPVVVEEPTEEEAISILKGLRGQYESHHHVTITDEAVEAAVRLSARYINDRFLPDKAIDLMDESRGKSAPSRGRRPEGGCRTPAGDCGVAGDIGAGTFWRRPGSGERGTDKASGTGRKVGKTERKGKAGRQTASPDRRRG